MSKLQLNGPRQLGVLLMLLALPLAARTPSATPGPAPAAASDAPAAAGDVPAPVDPSALPSELLARASKSLLLDVVRTSSGFVAVGERGHVLRSDDGKAWTQVQTPTRSALTTITALDSQVWAGGHDGVILYSADGGQSWTAQRRDPYRIAPGARAYDRDPRQGAPIMDILFTDASNGIAIGAYSLMLVTSDGGQTWTPRRAIAPVAGAAEPAAPMEGDIFSEEDLQLEEESDPHLNSIVRDGDTLFIVGERGTFLRSPDRGATWEKLAFPYKGSMFGVLHLGEGRLLAFGLRGNVYESADSGSSWRKVQAQGSTSLMGGSALPGGGAVLAGANGTVLVRASADAPFTLNNFRNALGETPALAGIVPVGDGSYVVVGDKGVDLAQLQ